MESPIDLATVPDQLGPWKGETAKIDEEIAKGTGAAQLVTRRYVNQATGVQIEVILLFGKAVNIYMHSPEVCYPSAGFALEGAMEDRLIPAGGDERARFRRMVYSKGAGTRAEHQEVYYAWWYDGRWTPTIGALKHFERVSGMYKVQIGRMIPATEALDAASGSPAESFLKELLPEFQRRLARRDAPAS
jgi:EpsI family protein